MHIAVGGGLETGRTCPGNTPPDHQTPTSIVRCDSSLHPSRSRNRQLWHVGRVGISERGYMSLEEPPLSLGLKLRARPKHFSKSERAGAGNAKATKCSGNSSRHLLFWDRGLESSMLTHGNISHKMTPAQLASHTALPPPLLVVLPRHIS
eukprot:scaffold847_cov199-Alexandrium_tamarense.AAC.10